MARNSSWEPFAAQRLFSYLSRMNACGGTRPGRVTHHGAWASRLVLVAEEKPCARGSARSSPAGGAAACGLRSERKSRLTSANRSSRRSPPSASRSCPPWLALPFVGESPGSDESRGAACQQLLGTAFGLANPVACPATPTARLGSLERRLAVVGPDVGLPVGGGLGVAPPAQIWSKGERLCTRAAGLPRAPNDRRPPRHPERAARRGGELRVLSICVTHHLRSIWAPFSLHLGFISGGSRLHLRSICASPSAPPSRRSTSRG